MAPDEAFAPVGIILLLAITVGIAASVYVAVRSYDTGEQPAAVGFLVREGERLEIVKTAGQPLDTEATRLLVGTPNGTASLGADELVGIGDAWNNGQPACLAGEGPRCLRILGADRIVDVRVVHANQLVYRWEGQPTVDLMAGSGPLISLEAGVEDPGHAFEDVDNDGLFTEGIDVEIPDAQIHDGDHHVPAGSGLVVPASVGPIDAANVHLSAGVDGHVLLQTDVTSGAQGILIEAGAGIRAEDVSFATQDEGIVLDAGEGLLAVDGSSFQTDDEQIDLASEGDISAQTATLTTAAEHLTITADGAVDLTDAHLQAPEYVQVTAGGDVTIEGAWLQAGEEISITTVDTATVRVEGSHLDDEDDVASLSPAGATIEGQPAEGDVAH